MKHLSYQTISEVYTQRYVLNFLATGWLNMILCSYLQLVVRKIYDFIILGPPKVYSICYFKSF